MNPRLIDAIKEKVPDSWDFVTVPSESDLNYEIYDVKEASIEFLHATAELKNYKDCFKVVWVKRIQNLCMYGRYILRHQQLRARNTTALEEIRYICIPENKISSLAKFNADPRHLELQNTQHVNNSQMAKSIPDALQYTKAFANADVLVMARVTTERGEIVSDSEVYPEYVVKLQNIDLFKLKEVTANQ